MARTISKGFGSEGDPQTAEKLDSYPLPLTETTQRRARLQRRNSVGPVEMRRPDDIETNIATTREALIT
jgi:hypothetical protein